jgi:hypothetical protein
MIVEELEVLELVLYSFFVELESVDLVLSVLLLESVELELELVEIELELREVSVTEVVPQLLRLDLDLELELYVRIVDEDDCGENELVVFSKKVELESVELVVLLCNVESVLDVDSELLEADDPVSIYSVVLLPLVEDKLDTDCCDGEMSLGVELLFSWNVDVDEVLLELELVDLVDLVLDENVREEVLRPFSDELESVDLELREGVENEDDVKSPIGSDELDPT